MKNSEILKTMLKEMEENHLNLYHDVSKEEIYNYISQIKDIDNLNCVQFDYEMCKLFSKFKDAHTMYFIPFKNINKRLFYLEGRLLIKDENNIYKVVSINGMPVKEFLSKIKETQCYETEEFLTDSIRYEINNAYYYEMLGLLENDEITFKVLDKDLNKIDINAKIVSLEEYKSLKLVEGTPFYSYQTLENDILYIKYRKCSEHKDYPFSQFVEEVEKEIKTKNCSKFVIDLRDNHGGDSSIIKPLIELLKKKNLTGVVIINNGVFSSGRWAVADFVKNFNSTLIGEPTGGAAASYGYNKNLSVEDKRFSVSTRYWDFSEIFKTNGTIKPDIFVPYTIKDLTDGTDSQLEEAINYVTKKQELKFD